MLAQNEKERAHKRARVSSKTSSQHQDDNQREWNIQIRNMAGETITLQVSPAKTVYELMLLYETHSGVSVSDQLLLWNGQQLKSACTIHGSGVADEETIDLVVADTFKSEKEAILSMAGFAGKRQNSWNKLETVTRWHELAKHRSITMTHGHVTGLELSEITGKPEP